MILVPTAPARSILTRWSTGRCYKLCLLGIGWLGRDTDHVRASLLRGGTHDSATKQQQRHCQRRYPDQSSHFGHRLSSCECPQSAVYSPQHPREAVTCVAAK